MKALGTDSTPLKSRGLLLWLYRALITLLTSQCPLLSKEPSEEYLEDICDVPGNMLGILRQPINDVSFPFVYNSGHRSEPRLPSLNISFFYHAQPLHPMFSKPGIRWKVRSPALSHRPHSSTQPSDLHSSHSVSLWHSGHPSQR